MCVSLWGQESHRTYFISPPAPSTLLSTVLRTWLIDSSDPNFTLPCHLSFSPIGIGEWLPSFSHPILQRKQKLLSENTLTFLQHPSKSLSSPILPSILLKERYIFNNAKVHPSTYEFYSIISHLLKVCFISLFFPFLSYVSSPLLSFNFFPLTYINTEASTSQRALGPLSSPSFLPPPSLATLKFIIQYCWLYSLCCALDL